MSRQLRTILVTFIIFGLIGLVLMSEFGSIFKTGLLLILILTLFGVLVDFNKEHE